MKTLLWKDYRENRTLLMLVGVFCLIPYLMFIGASISELSSGRESHWVEILWGSSSVAVYLAAGITSFIAGNAIAGERANRSAEFAAYLPIPRKSAIVSKAIIAIGGCLFFILINGAINLATMSAATSLVKYWVDFLAAGIVFGGPAVVLMFGIAWLSSSFTSSPVISAVAGMAAFVLQMGTLAYSSVHTDGRVGDAWVVWYVSSSLIVGIGSFVAGVVYYLRRVEP
jgi:ABC-type transport system involved in multi-copper enzyme maturation permease subunit